MSVVRGGLIQVRVGKAAARGLCARSVPGWLGMPAPGLPDGRHGRLWLAVMHLVRGHQADTDVMVILV